MRRKDAHDDELEGVARRLRSERPLVDPLALDRVKTTVVSRVQPAGVRGGAGRRFAVVGLTVGLIAAGTGGVIAAGGTGHSSGNAATAQYGDPSGGVLGAKQSRALTVSYRVRIHVPNETKLKTVTVKVNGKIVTVRRGGKASASFKINLSCAKGVTTVTVIAVTDAGKTIKQSHRLKGCET